MDVEPERVAAERRRIGRRANDNGQHSRPVRRGGELAALVAALIPGDAEAVSRCPDDILHIDRNLLVGEVRERVVGARIIVERSRAASRLCR